MSYALGESSILCVFVFNKDFCKNIFDEEIAAMGFSRYDCVLIKYRDLPRGR